MLTCHKTSGHIKMKETMMKKCKNYGKDKCFQRCREPRVEEEKTSTIVHTVLTGGIMKII